jgi:hypothetical protein
LIVVNDLAFRYKDATTYNAEPAEPAEQTLFAACSASSALIVVNDLAFRYKDATTYNAEPAEPAEQMLFCCVFSELGVDRR